MSLAKPTRREKQQQRAARILHSARVLARENGFLTLNVADVARQARVSVGTLYAHFQSKEGLVAALAVHALRGRVETFTAITEREKRKPTEKLVLIILADFLFSVDHPELFAAEQLAASTAVLKAVPGGLFQWLPPEQLIDNRVEDAARQAIDAGEFSAWKDRAKQAAAIDRGIWTLMAGSSYIWNVTVAAQTRAGAAAHIPAWVKENASALLIGFGWQAKQPARQVERWANVAIAEARFLSKTCGELDEAETDV